MNGENEASDSTEQQNNTGTDALTSASVISVASAPDLPSATVSNDSPSSQPSQTQTLTPPPQTSSIPHPNLNQRPSVVVTLPNQVPIASTPSNPIVLASSVPGGSIVVPSTAISGSIPVTIATPINFANGSVVTVSVDNTSKAPGNILTPVAPIISVASTPVIQTVTSSSVATPPLAPTPTPPQQQQQSKPESAQQSQSVPIPAFNSKSLHDIIKEVDPYLQLDDETEEMLKYLAEEFLENVAKKSLRLANHRGSAVVESRDVKHVLGMSMSCIPFLMFNHIIF